MRDKARNTRLFLEASIEMCIQIGIQIGIQMGIVIRIEHTLGRSGMR